VSNAERRFLAFDLGAESGRGILGLFNGERLDLTQVRRFTNGPVEIFAHLYWDPLRLFAEMKETLRDYVQAHGPHLDAMGVDTWGVDYGLLGRGDILLENPRHYRDPRTDGMPEAAFARVPRDQIFAQTGIQFMKFNTLYQLLAMQEAQSPLLEMAEDFLMIADLFNFFFTGEKVCEFSNATTTQFYNPIKGGWATELLDSLNLPTSMLPPIIAPGTTIGPLLYSIRQQTGLDQVNVIAPATHDTGSAVVAVPAETSNYAYISSGTWSLMGAELDAPRLDAQALKFNFTNEGGAGGTFRFLKNIMGLWLVQESRRQWERQGRSFSYNELAELAAKAPAFSALLDPDTDAFIAPGDMPERIRAYCRRTNQPKPADEGTLIRVILESLALKYRYVAARLQEITGRRLECIHMVGGGIQNHLLCQLTANATGLPLIAGPLEATAIGNVLMQAIGTGDLANLDQARQVVRRSFEPKHYEPSGSRDAWDQAYARFKELLPIT
jgi:rhamnulokinase